MKQKGGFFFFFLKFIIKFNYDSKAYNAIMEQYGNR